MTREEMLERSERWISEAEGRATTEELEIRYLRIAEMWLRLAAEMRKGYSAPISLDVN